MSLMDLNLMLSIRFVFNLSGAEVEEEILATQCHLLGSGQNLVVGIFKILETMYEMFVKQLYKFQEKII